jgi:hypothetical protein
MINWFCNHFFFLVGILCNSVGGGCVLKNNDSEKEISLLIKSTKKFAILIELSLTEDVKSTEKPGKTN